MRCASIVLVADYGIQDCRTALMTGYIKQAEPALEVYPAQIALGRQDIGQTSGALYAMLPFWPAGTVFLNLVHGGGDAAETDWLLLQLKNGCLVLSPDNGGITMPLRVLETAGLYRMPEQMDDGQAARLAGTLARDGLTPSLLGQPVTGEEICQLPWTEPELARNRASGVIVQVMQNFGNLTTNIPISAFQTITDICAGDWVRLTVTRAGQVFFDQEALYHHSFGFAEDGAPIVFNGSTGFMGFGLNRRNFVKTHLPLLDQPGQVPTEYQVSIVKVDRREQDEK